MRLERKLMTVPVLLLFARGGFGQGGPQQKESVAVAINVARVEFRPGVPALVKLTMTNTSDRDIRLNVMVVQCRPLINEYVTVRQMQLHLYDSEGNLMPLTLYGKVVQGGPEPDEKQSRNNREAGVSCGGGGTLGILKPGESLTEEADLNKEFEIKKPGKYTVRAQRVDQESKAVVMSAAVPVTLVAKQ
jgi:hypothetical protein